MTPYTTRSKATFTFPHAPPGPAIVAESPDGAFLDFLIRQNKVRSFLEDNDEAYRQLKLGERSLGLTRAQEAAIVGERAENPRSQQQAADGSDAVEGSAPAGPNASVGNASNVPEWVGVSTSPTRPRQRTYLGRRSTLPVTPARSRGRGESTSPQPIDTITRLQRSLQLVPADDYSPTPIVDENGLVIGLVAHCPSPDRYEWTASAAQFARALNVLCRRHAWDNGALRWGAGMQIAAGYGHPGPGQLPDNPFLTQRAGNFTQNETLKLVAAYHNHLLSEYFPGHAAYMAAARDQLTVLADQVKFPFPPTVFPVSELRLLDASSPEALKDLTVAVGDIAALTVFGNWDPLLGGHFIDHDAQQMTPTRCGTTILWACGTRAYGFAPVQEGEHQYVFLQYFDSALLRWMEKGGMGDEELEGSKARDAKERLQKWKRGRAMRAQKALKLFSKLAAIRGA